MVKISSTGFRIFRHGFLISQHVRACRHVILAPALTFDVFVRKSGCQTLHGRWRIFTSNWPERDGQTDRQTDRRRYSVIQLSASHTQGGSYSYNNYYYRILNLHDLLHDMCTIYCIVCLFCCVHHLRRQTVLLLKTL